MSCYIIMNNREKNKSKGEINEPFRNFKTNECKGIVYKNHPKFSAFVKRPFPDRSRPGTIIEISLQRPGEEPMMANIKVQQEDLDLLESLKGLSE